MNGVKLYCGISERRWNHHDIDCCGYACISPIKGQSERTRKKSSVYVPKGTQVIQDSGAFSDSFSSRLSFDVALDRQLAHSEQYQYSDLIKYRATYDWLIDEVWQNGMRSKKRWTLADAEQAVAETVSAAQYYQHHADKPLVVSAQGVDEHQYMDCTQQLMDYFDPNKDVFGLGGWCIIGKMPAQMMSVFERTIVRVIPYLAKNHVKQVHIWGVIYPAALGKLLYVCTDYGLEVSTDSAGPSLNPTRGEWGYGEWRNNDYQTAPVDIRGLERIRHVQLTRDWLARLHQTQWYKSPQDVPKQLTMF